MAAIAGIKSLSVDIDIGVALTAEIDLEGLSIQGIHMPAAWTAANLTFLGAEASLGTFQDLTDSGGTEVSVTASAGVAIALLDADLIALRAFRFIKIRSGTSGVPVNQVAARVLVLSLRASG